MAADDPPPPTLGRGDAAPPGPAATHAHGTEQVGMRMNDHKERFRFVRNNIFYFSDTTALVSGFVPNLMEVTQNVLCMGWGRGRNQKIKKKKKMKTKFWVAFSICSTPTLIEFAWGFLMKGDRSLGGQGRARRGRRGAGTGDPQHPETAPAPRGGRDHAARKSRLR